MRRFGDDSDYDGNPGDGEPKRMPRADGEVVALTADRGGSRRKPATDQFPMQILVPAETRDALRQRSAETGASIRHIILRSLAADGFPVPKVSRWRQ